MKDEDYKNVSREVNRDWDRCKREMVGGIINVGKENLILLN